MRARRAFREPSKRKTSCDYPAAPNNQTAVRNSISLCRDVCRTYHDAGPRKKKKIIIKRATSCAFRFFEYPFPPSFVVISRRFCYHSINDRRIRKKRKKQQQSNSCLQAAQKRTKLCAKATTHNKLCFHRMGARPLFTEYWQYNVVELQNSTICASICLSARHILRAQYFETPIIHVELTRIITLISSQTNYAYKMAATCVASRMSFACSRNEIGTRKCYALAFASATPPRCGISIGCCWAG